MPFNPTIAYGCLSQATPPNTGRRVSTGWYPTGFTRQRTNHVTLWLMKSLTTHRLGKLRKTHIAGEAQMTALHASSQTQLRQFIEQIERLEEEKKALAADIRDKFLEAKAVGFDPKIMKKVISLRKLSQTERDEIEAVMSAYLHALDGTPMGDFIAREDEANARGVARAHGISQPAVDDLVDGAQA